MDQAKGFLGMGWKFPVCVDQATGRIKTSSYEEDIAEAIRIIIMTAKGERAMNPEFGCGIRDYLFEDVNYTIQNQMQNVVRDALTQWEPRITDVEVEVRADDRSSGMLMLHIGYLVRATNNPFNLVYPFYLNEGF